jgi:hypothetical protein
MGRKAWKANPQKWSRTAGKADQPRFAVAPSFHPTYPFRSAIPRHLQTLVVISAAFPGQSSLWPSWTTFPP